MKAYDVIIIGAGIAGLSQALALTQVGFSVALVDHCQAPSAWQTAAAWDNRVFALTPASATLYHDLNVWPLLLKRRITQYQHMHLWWPGFIDRALVLNATDAAVSELGHIVEQNVLRDALWQQLSHTPLSAYWGQAWQALTHTDAGSTLRLADGQVLQAALIIAADGAHSAVRNYVANTELAFSHQACAMVATLNSEQRHQSIARQVFHTTGTLALLPLANPHVSSLVWSVPVAKAEALQRLSGSAFAKSVSLAVDHVLGELSLESKPQCFPLQALCADTFVMPGLAFIADAAHVIHPLAGLGLNLGLADVACLTGQLLKAKRLKRPLGHLSTLKPYGRRRKVAAMHMITLMCLLEKSGRLSAKCPNILSNLVNSCLGTKNLFKTSMTTIALRALNP